MQVYWLNGQVSNSLHLSILLIIIYHSDCDEEILKWLHSMSFNIKKTYEAMQLKKELSFKKFPVIVNSNVFNLLNSGFIYVCGRDRLFRPIIVMRVHVLNEMHLTPEVDEVIAAIFLNIKFV